MEIWSFCDCGIWLSAAYVPGKDNVEADEESRRINFDTEWQIRPDLLGHALFILEFEPRIDLFASRLNHQCPVYVAYRPDPEAIAIDSFTLSWSGIQFCASPPFCIISSMLQKITKDKAQGVVVMPYWPNQLWFPRLASMLTSEPVLLSAKEDLLQLPMANHHLRKHLHFLICKKSSGFLKQAVSILCSSWIAGTKNQYATYINKWRVYAFKRHTDLFHLSESKGVNFPALLFHNSLSYSSICVEHQLCLVSGDWQLWAVWRTQICEKIHEGNCWDLLSPDMQSLGMWTFVPSRQINIEGTVLQSDNVDCPFIGPEMPDVVVSRCLLWHYQVTNVWLCWMHS